VLGLNHFQIEFLANLDQVPEAGALVMVAFPKAQGGTGFPARVVAIVPR
jgi:kynurenine formamidase